MSDNFVDQIRDAVSEMLWESKYVESLEHTKTSALQQASIRSRTIRKRQKKK